MSPSGAEPGPAAKQWKPPFYGGMQLIQPYLYATTGFTKTKSRTTKGSSFGSSAIFFKDPPLSVPPSRMVWLYRVTYFS
jgi:hypothetical protein